MIHRASDEKFALNVGNGTADPVAVWTNDLDTVAEAKRDKTFDIQRRDQHTLWRFPRSELSGHDLS